MAIKKKMFPFFIKLAFWGMKKSMCSGVIGFCVGQTLISLGSEVHTWYSREILTKLVNIEEMSSSSVSAYRIACSHFNKWEIKNKIIRRNRKKLKH